VFVRPSYRSSFVVRAAFVLWFVRSSQVKNYSPGCMEQAPNRGHARPVRRAGWGWVWAASCSPAAKAVWAECTCGVRGRLSSVSRVLIGSWFFYRGTGGLLSARRVERAIAGLWAMRGSKRRNFLGGSGLPPYPAQARRISTPFIFYVLGVSSFLSPPRSAVRRGAWKCKTRASVRGCSVSRPHCSSHCRKGAPCVLQTARHKPRLRWGDALLQGPAVG
jgi:hypothetical protein